MAEGFRIQNIAIEGFKGFTSRQQIDFDGRHAFFLGRNGLGKSSIIEAIRWGLFGSTGRRNEVVANRGYAGPCRVEITLLRDGEIWSLRRTMLRGVTGGNDTVLTDKAGKEHSIGDLLPKMDSIDAGEGTHIIFAPQAGSQRRLPEDLSPFERTVFQHLGLTEARSVIGVLNEFLVDQQLAEDSIGTKITQARDEIEENIKYLQRRRGTILEAPPWGVEPIPSVADTEKKLRSLISGLSDSPQEELPSGISMTALIGKAEEILGKTQDADSIRDLLGQLGSAHQEIEDLESLVSVDISLSAKIETNESLLANILDGRSIVDLASRVEKERDSSTEAEIKQRVARDSATLLSRNQEARVNCPVCGAEHDLQDLKSDLDQLAIEGSNIEASSGLLEAENELKKTKELAELIQLSRDKQDEIKGQIRTAMTSLANMKIVDVPSEPTPTDLHTATARVDEQIALTQNQLDDYDLWFSQRKSEVANLKSEQEFHQIQKDVGSLVSGRAQMDVVDSSFRDLVAFGASVQSILDTTEDALKDQLEAALPVLADNLSNVFASLTHHPWYDRLVIPGERLPKLELRVASSSEEEGNSYPPDVLNGQAQSALAGC